MISVDVKCLSNLSKSLRIDPVEDNDYAKGVADGMDIAAKEIDRLVEIQVDFYDRRQNDGN